MSAYRPFRCMRPRPWNCRCPTAGSVEAVHRVAIRRRVANPPWRQRISFSKAVHLRRWGTLGIVGTVQQRARRPLMFLASSGVGLSSGPPWKLTTPTTPCRCGRAQARSCRRSSSRSRHLAVSVVGASRSVAGPGLQHALASSARCSCTSLSCSPSSLAASDASPCRMSAAKLRSRCWRAPAARR